MDASLNRLYEHLAWADSLLLDALEALGDPPEEAMRLLGHLFGAERIWLMRIRGEDSSVQSVWPRLSLVQCRALAEEARAGFRDILQGATAGRLAAPIAYRNAKGQPFESSLGDILLHIALHGAHHRGQIAALLRREGREPAATDFILFSRLGGSGPP